jgi:enoyl-CoA hydratase
MSNPLIETERDGDVAVLTFNEPERLNAMSRAMGEAFAAQVAPLAADTSLRALVLTGAGRAFSAGGDLDMLQAQADDGSARPGIARREIRDAMRGFYKLFLSVRDIPCPTIAALNGAAVGAGFCVALACDIRIAAENAKLGLNFTRIGLQPGMGATWTLPRLVGPAHAAEILYAGRLMSGSDAAAIHLVNRALPADEVLPAARRLAAEFAANAPAAIRSTKRALARSHDATLEDQLSFEAHEQSIHFEMEDAQEGIAAVKERRPPNFKGV